MSNRNHETTKPPLQRCRAPRRQIMLDQSVQGTLMKRVTTYWFFCLGSISLMSWVWSTFLNPELTVQAWARDHLVPLVVPMIGSFVLLPLAWADMIRMSNRIVAPVHSIRTAIRRLLLGDDVPPLTSRSGDFWPDLTKQFNQLSAAASFDRPRTETSDSVDPP